MPDVQEVFRLATNKVKPDPNALERQQKRQRASTRSTRARAYLVVAAVIAAIAIGVLAIMRTADCGDTTPGGPTPPTTLTFVTALPSGADAQTPAIVDLRGHQTGQVTGLPVDAFAPSVSADGSTIAFVASPSELGYNQIGVMGADGSDPHFISTPHVIVGATVAISPDASKVAFEGLTTGNADIYVVGVDGTGLRQLTTDPGDRPVSRNGRPTGRRSSTTTPARTRTARIPSSRRRRRSSPFPPAAARRRGSRTTAGPTPRPRIPRTGRRS